MPFPCANGCGRETPPRSRFCRECLAGDVPLPCPALLPTGYLEACSLELAGRGGERGAVASQRADQRWVEAVANALLQRLSTSSTESSTSEVEH